MHEHKWHRQSGLLDQDMVASLEIVIDGHDESVLAMLLQLDLLGACRNGSGVVRISRDPLDEVSIRMLRGLVDFSSSTWEGIQKMFGKRGMEVTLCEAEEADIWIGTADCPRPELHRGHWLIHGAGSALVGSGRFSQIDSMCVRETMVDAQCLLGDGGRGSLAHPYC